MGCVIVQEEGQSIECHQRAFNRTMKIDTRKKSCRVPDKITENIKILFETIAIDSE